MEYKADEKDIRRVDCEYDFDIEELSIEDSKRLEDVAEQQDNFVELVEKSFMELGELPMSVDVGIKYRLLLDIKDRVIYISEDKEFTIEVVVSEQKDGSGINLIGYEVKDLSRYGEDEVEFRSWEYGAEKDYTKYHILTMYKFLDYVKEDDVCCRVKQKESKECNICGKEKDYLINSKGEYEYFFNNISVEDYEGYEGYLRYKSNIHVLLDEIESLNRRISKLEGK